MSPELLEFFANRDRLRQIQRLHRLLFECLQAAEEEFPERVKRAMDRIASDCADRWKRLDETTDRCTRIGFVWSGKGRWPRDLSVHFGWGKALFDWKPWVGVYTLTEDRPQFNQIQAAVRDALPRPIKEEGFGGDYPVYKELEEWPVGCGRGRISSSSSVEGLANVLAEGDSEPVAMITEQVQQIIAKLDR